MSQDSWIILLLKVVLVCGAVSVALFVAEYTWRTRWGCFRNDIGRTLVWKDILLIACLLPSILSLFFQFTRLTSHVAAWVDVGLFGLLTPAMWWRIAVFERVHKQKDAPQIPDNEETLCSPGSLPCCSPSRS